jgi:hypothetical protein
LFFVANFAVAHRAEPRPPAKLMVATSPGGGSAVRATVAKPPADTPTAIIRDVSTSGRPPRNEIAALRSAAPALPAAT